jgi:hypothetical protein
MKPGFFRFLLIIINNLILIIWWHIVTIVKKVVNCFEAVKVRFQRLKTIANSLTLSWKLLPEKVEPVQLFPSTIGNFRLIERNNHIKTPEFNLNIPGYCAVYGSGRKRIKIFIYFITMLAKETLFSRVTKMINTMDALYSTPFGYSNGTIFNFSFEQTKEEGLLWWNERYLFLILTTGAIKPETFFKIFIKSISQHSHIDSGFSPRPGDNYGDH